MSLDRRQFIGIAVGALAAGALPGCASAALTRVSPTNGLIRLPLEDFPQLAGSSGYLKLLPEGASTPVYVLASESGQYAALSPVCTHLGCIVDVEGVHLVCPCHGSTYDRMGQVLRGPAEQPLRRFPTTTTPEGELVIRMEENS